MGTFPTCTQGDVLKFWFALAKMHIWHIISIKAEGKPPTDFYSQMIKS